MVFVTIYGLVNPVHNETSDKKEMEIILQRFLHVGRTEKSLTHPISVHTSYSIGSQRQVI